MRPSGRRCPTGKIRYRDQIAAKFALSQAQHKDGSKRGKIERRDYFCQRCRGWHLTARD
jgi:hypothetical protein